REGAGAALRPGGAGRRHRARPGVDPMMPRLCLVVAACCAMSLPRTTDLPPEGGSHIFSKNVSRLPPSGGRSISSKTVSWLPPSGGRSLAAPLFVESAAATGLDFTHVNGATGQYYMAEQMGAGVALFDYDNDGDLDVFLVQGGPFDEGARRTTGPTCKLFRNDLTDGPNGKRTLHFTDVTERAGLALRTYGMGAAVGDYNNDGYLD